MRSFLLLVHRHLGQRCAGHTTGSHSLSGPSAAPLPLHWQPFWLESSGATARAKWRHLVWVKTAASWTPAHHGICAQCWRPGCLFQDAGEHRQAGSSFKLEFRTFAVRSDLSSVRRLSWMLLENICTRNQYLTCTCLKGACPRMFASINRLPLLSSMAGPGRRLSRCLCMCRSRVKRREPSCFFASRNHCCDAVDATLATHTRVVHASFHILLAVHRCLTVRERRSPSSPVSRNLTDAACTPTCFGRRAAHIPA